MEAASPRVLTEQARWQACHLARLEGMMAAQQERIEAFDRSAPHLSTVGRLCRAFRRERTLAGRVAERVGNLEERERIAEAQFQIPRLVLIGWIARSRPSIITFFN